MLRVIQMVHGLKVYASGNSNGPWSAPPEPHIQMLTKSHMNTSTKNVYVGKTTTFYIHEKD